MSATVQMSQYVEKAQEAIQLHAQLQRCHALAQGQDSHCAPGDYDWSPACHAIQDLRQRVTILERFVAPIVAQFVELEAWLAAHQTTMAPSSLAFKVRHHMISFGEMRDLHAVLYPSPLIQSDEEALS